MAKTFLAVLAAIGLMVILPLYSCAQTSTTDTPYDTKALPPVEQTLVREGDFAFALTPALKLGEPGSEAEAQEMLALAGIAPESGWISDYPVTPAVIGDIRTAVRKAASEGRIKLDTAEADKAVMAVADDFGLPAMADTKGTQEPETVAETSPATTYDETALTDYYYDYGPPAITYYEPPYDYGYLYDYVYDPFWCSGFYFPGYYILQNFTIVVDSGRHGRRHGKWRDKDWTAVGGAGRGGRGSTGGTAVVSNQEVDPATGQARVVDPVTRQAVDPATERSRREARRAEWTSGRTAENPDRAGFRRARAEGRNVFGNSVSAGSVGGTASISGNESGIRSLQRELSRSEGSRGERPGRGEIRRNDAAAQSIGPSSAGRATERVAPSAARPSGGDNDRPMSTRGWTYGTTGGGRSSDNGGSAVTERQSVNTGGGSSDRAAGGSRGREMNTDTGRSRGFDAAPSIGGGDRGSRGRDWNTNTGYAGRGREASPGAGGFSSGRSFDRPASIQSAPMVQPAPSFAPSAPSRSFGGGGFSGRSERSFGRSESGQGSGDRGGGGRAWSGGGDRGGGGGHDRGGGGRGGGGSCRGRNC